jgi:hypothetical protein
MADLANLTDAVMRGDRFRADGHATNAGAAVDLARALLAG